MAGLGDPRLRYATDVLARGRRERVPEVARGRAAASEAAQVSTYALAKGVLTQVRLEHAQDGRALLVRHRVDALEGRLRARRIGADRVRRREGVEREAARRAEHEIAPHRPLRMHGVLGLVTDERRERLGQPEVIPPRERREVTPPHVRELV